MGAEAKNLYELLGVAATATPSQIRRAYRKRIVVSHRQGVLNLVDRMDDLKQAYQTLRDPSLRHHYDLERQRSRTSSLPPASGDPKIAREVAVRQRMSRERVEHSARSGAVALKDNAETVRQLVEEHDQQERQRAKRRARRVLLGHALRGLLFALGIAVCAWAVLR
jgi:curved DNA-binding protein CbpA